MGCEFFEISSATGLGIEQLKFAMAEADIGSGAFSIGPKAVDLVGQLGLGGADFSLPRISIRLPQVFTSFAEGGLKPGIPSGED